MVGQKKNCFNAIVQFLCFCPCSKHSGPWRDNNNIIIHHDHGCMVGLMTPQELLQHLRSEGDATHTAISIYLETLITFSWGNVRQDPSVNSKKKPHSEEEEKEEELNLQKIWQKLKQFLKTTFWNWRLAKITIKHANSSNC